MKQIGNKCNIVVFALLLIVHIVTTVVMLIVDVEFGVFWALIVTVGLIWVANLKSVYISRTDVIVEGLWGKRQMYTLDDIQAAGGFMFSYGYISFANGEFYIFQRPLSSNLFNPLGRLAYSANSYSEEIWMYIDKMKSLR